MRQLCLDFVWRLTIIFVPVFNAVCLQLPSNQSLYRQTTGYWKSVDDHRIAWRWKGLTDKQIRYMTLAVTLYMTLIWVHRCMVKCTPINVM